MKYLFCLPVFLFVLSTGARNSSDLSRSVSVTANKYLTDAVDSTGESINVLQGDSIVKTIPMNNASSSPMDIIIELNEQPLINTTRKAQKEFGSRSHIKSIAAIKQARDIIEGSHTRLKLNLRQIDDEDTIKRKSIIRREYREVFNGLVLCIYKF